MTDEQDVSLETVDDDFVAAVPTDDSRTILVYGQRHEETEYVRIRACDRDPAHSKWAPTMRCLVVPRSAVLALAATGRPQAKPNWLLERENAIDVYKDDGFGPGRYPIDEDLAAVRKPRSCLRTNKA